MSQIVTWQHPLLLRWLETEIHSQIPRPATTIALFKGREPLAVVGYFNYDGITIEGAIAAAQKRAWANKTFVRAAFAYPFQQLGCRRFVVRVEASNTEALEFAIRALKDLQQAGRMVGIISHVSELREWMDARLEVRSGAAGSTAEFVV